MLMEIIKKPKNVEIKESVNCRGLSKKNVLYDPQPLLIECKNKLDIYAAATSYKLAIMLHMPQIIPVCIEGEGLSPFTDALFVAQLHLKTGTTDVFIGATDPTDSIRCEFIHVRAHENNSLQSGNFLLQPNNTQSESDEQYVYDWAIVLRKKKSGCYENSLNNDLPMLKPDYNSVYDLFKFINDRQLIQNSRYGSIRITNPYKNINDTEEPDV